jgi:PAS domain S-box-containing protein
LEFLHTMDKDQSPQSVEAAAYRKRIAAHEDEIVRLQRERDDAIAALLEARTVADEVRRDNIEIKDSLASLRRTERRLDLILESATEYAIFTLDLEGQITSWNTGARNILGWERDDILGRKGDVIFTSEDQHHRVFEAEMTKALADGRAGDERWHLRKDGSRFWATGTLMPLRNGTVEGFLKILRDRTEERRAEEEREELRRTLDAERAVLKAVLERLPSGLIVSEALSGRHLVHNEEAVRLLGHKLEEVTDWSGYASYGAVHSDGTPYRAEEYPLVRTSLSGEVIDQEEVIYRRGDGRVTTFSVNAAPVRGVNGDIALAVTTFHDVSERKAMEEALLLRDNQNHVRCDNQALLMLMSFIQRKLHPAIMLPGGQAAVKPGPFGPRLWRLRA